MGIDDVLERRRTERRQLLTRAREFAGSLPGELSVRAVVVFGSVARGDFNLWSDVDVLVIADRLPERFLDRLDALAPWPARIQPIAWTSREWQERLARRDPIALESVNRGVWLVGRCDGFEGG
ncbi:MAG: nucleotidyltransferase domain-containing protein [Actinomycetota bacterium]|nr:nucleotidyltransferase domain-containing protein [Actinomycetota bacterium]